MVFNRLLLLIVLIVSFVCHAEEYPASMASGTLPKVIINTENNQPIVDKETKINAKFSLEIPKNYSTYSGIKPTDIKNATMTIKGRGNASWKLDKKPYKLKFDKKTSVLGMPAHKHFALIAYAGGMVGFWLPGVVGMEMARASGQSWAPSIEPVELILNGEYLGLYFVVESIKIDPDRLDIYEQPDYNSDSSTIPYGWLVEVDNYYSDESSQIVIQESDLMKLRISFSSPEILNEAQREWLTNEFTAINAAIYSDDKSGEDWAKYIDATSAARYFIIRELLNDTDGYNGSMYLHKDKGDKALWAFGPMWDLAYQPKKDWIMNDHPSYAAVHWFHKLFYTDVFKNALVEQWNLFSPKFDNFLEAADRIAAKCKEADVINKQRWPQYESGDSEAKARSFKNGITANHKWMDEQIKAIASVDNVAVGSNALFRIIGNSISTGMCADNFLIDVFSTTGSNVLSTTAGAMECIDISHLPKGMYIVRATTFDGKIYSEKMVKW